MADRTIFRDTALEAYRRRTNGDVVPRLTSWPVIICLWLLLAVLVAAAAVAWSVQVPAYISAQGVILRSSAQPVPGGGKAAAALFLPPGQTGSIRAGQPVHGQMGSSGRYVAGEVTRIESGVIGPAAARDRYRADGAPGVITQPSRVVIVRLDAAPRSLGNGGSRLATRIQVSSQPLLAFFPGLGKLFGGGA